MEQVVDFGTANTQDLSSFGNGIRQLVQNRFNTFILYLILTSLCWYYITVKLQIQPKNPVFYMQYLENISKARTRQNSYFAAFNRDTKRLCDKGKKQKILRTRQNTYFAAFAIKYHVFPNCLLCTIRNERRSYQALEVLLYRYDYSLVSRPLFDPLFDPLAVSAMFTLFNSSYTFIEIP